MNKMQTIGLQAWDVIAEEISFLVEFSQSKRTKQHG